jgi:hypothetical protein
MTEELPASKLHCSHVYSAAAKDHEQGPKGRRANSG